jgi:hypothetical protein
MALNFRPVEKQGQPAAPGEGHFHYFIDIEPPTAPGIAAAPDEGVWAHTANTTYTFINVMPGTHTFSVELVNNDHTPLNPPVVATATVTVRPPSPRVTVLLPQNRSVLRPGDITVTVSLANFNPVDKLGQANAPGEGHIHYYLDAEAPTEPGKPAVTAPGTYAATSATSYTWKNVTPGTHTFWVQLVNNDHTPLSPPVVIKVVVTVSAAAAGGP